MGTDDKEEEQIVFHYSRERRLKSASERVRALNSEAGIKRPGILKSLTANRSLRLLFLTIILLSGITMLVRMVNNSSNITDVNGNTVELKAFSFEKEAYITLKKKAKTVQSDKALPYHGPVRLSICLYGTKTVTLNEDILFSTEKNEEFRFKIAGEGTHVEVLLEIPDRRFLIKASVQ